MSNTPTETSEELSVEEIRKLIVDGKVKLNKIIKAVVESVVSIPANNERRYVRVKEVRAPKGQTILEKKEYAKAYYKKNKDKFKEKYQKNRDILNENGKKYYQLRKLKKLAPSNFVAPLSVAVPASVIPEYIYAGTATEGDD
jgi:hypothetical protein